MRGTRLVLAGLLGLLPLALPGDAYAAPQCSDGGFPGSGGVYNITLLTAMGTIGCEIGDKIYSNFSFTNLSSGAFVFTMSGADHTFSGTGLNFTNTTTPFSYSYKVSITGAIPGQEFTKFNTNAAGSSTTGSAIGFTKTLVAQSLTSTATEISSGNTPTFAAGTVGPITFTGNLSLTGGKIDQFTDSLSQKFADPAAVPSPVPFLGAAAAFGFSRKLRRRITPSV
jgi:hypothetical protein